MPYYLVEFSYTKEAVAALIQNPPQPYRDGQVGPGGARRNYPRLVVGIRRA